MAGFKGALFGASASGPTTPPVSPYTVEYLLIAGGGGGGGSGGTSNAGGGGGAGINLLMQSTTSIYSNTVMLLGWIIY